MGGSIHNIINVLNARECHLEMVNFFFLEEIEQWLLFSSSREGNTVCTQNCVPKAGVHSQEQSGVGDEETEVIGSWFLPLASFQR